MWQWNAHAPGLSQSMTTSQRSPGLTPSVSQLKAALPSGQPSRATTCIGIPWRCHGWVMTPSFMNRITILSPSFATIGAVAGKPRPLIVKPPRVSLLIQTSVIGHAIEVRDPLGRVLGVHDERPEQPAPDLVRRVVVRVVHVRTGGLRRELVTRTTHPGVMDPG